MLPDFGWTELLVIGIVLIVVVGPKDLPRVIRGITKSLGSMRKMAGDFRKQFDEALTEAELDDLKTLANDVKGLDPRNSIKDALNPLGEVGKELDSELRGVKRSLEQSARSEKSGTDAVNAQVKKNISPEEAYPQFAKADKDGKSAEATKSETGKKTVRKSPRGKATTPKPAAKKAVANKKPGTRSSSPTTMTAASKTATAPAKTNTRKSAAKKPVARKAPAKKTKAKAEGKA